VISRIEGWFPTSGEGSAIADWVMFDLPSGISGGWDDDPEGISVTLTGNITSSALRTLADLIDGRAQDSDG
jgi:hypothetical protein